MMAQQESIDVPGLSHSVPIPLGCRMGPLLCSSGINGKDEQSGQLSPDAPTQIECAFRNLQSFLQAGGATVGHVAKLTVYLPDDAHRQLVNTHWVALWPDEKHRPARHTLSYPLKHGMHVQLEVIAYIGD